MKIIVTEVEMDKWKTVYTINLNSESGLIWDCGLKKYELTEDLMLDLKHQEVIGWVDGVNRFGKPVKRTYMLLP